MKLRAPALFVCCASALLLLAGSGAAAPMVTIDVVGDGVGPTTVNSFGTGTPNGDTLDWSLDGPFDLNELDPLLSGDIILDSWTATFKEDPFVTNNIVVTNNTAVTQTFIATVLLPIPVFNYDEIINSSVGVTTTDSNGDGILSFANSGLIPIYQGTVNGSTLLSFNPPGMPLTTADCPVPFAGCTAVAAIGTASQSVAPGVANQIGITLTFTLSAGDSAGITSRFEIIQVIPEPGTASLLGLGLVMLAVRRRR